MPCRVVAVGDLDRILQTANQHYWESVLDSATTLNREEVQARNRIKALVGGSIPRHPTPERDPKVELGATTPVCLGQQTNTPTW
jgi:hypothetical protein